MQALSYIEMRALDRAAIDGGTPGVVLMRRAGLAVAESVRRLATMSGVRDLPILLLAGKGNNGGDAFAAAEFLASWGYAIRVFATLESASDALAFRQSPSIVPHIRALSELPECVPHGSILVDGLLGTGTHGAPHGEIAEAIRWLARHRRDAGQETGVPGGDSGAGQETGAPGGGGYILSIDIPSGLDADTGVVHSPCVSADVTVTLAQPKTGMALPAARDISGRVEIADIGLPCTDRNVCDTLEWIAEAELRRSVPVRPRDAHKGMSGHLALLAGSDGLAGAATLAALGALNSGCGLVSVRTLARALSQMPPEVMVRPYDATEEFLKDMTAVVVGPGLGQDAGAFDALAKSLTFQKCPMVLDADALNLLAQHSDLLGRIPRGSVITPHPGEAARLLGITAAEVQKNRVGALGKLVEMTRATVALKGADTLVGAPGQNAFLCGAGNPGMAVGGMGDVLAGLIGGLMARGMDAAKAAKLGVWLHATAGDFAAWSRTPHALQPSGLVERLPMAWKALMGG